MATDTGTWTQAREALATLAEQIKQVSGTAPVWYVSSNGGSAPYTAVFLDAPGSDRDPQLRTRVDDPAAAVAHMRAKLHAAEGITTP